MRTLDILTWEIIVEWLLTYLHALSTLHAGVRLILVRQGLYSSVIILNSREPGLKI